LALFEVAGPLQVAQVVIGLPGGVQAQLGYQLRRTLRALQQVTEDRQAHIAAEDGEQLRDLPVRRGEQLADTPPAAVRADAVPRIAVALAVNDAEMPDDHRAARVRGIERLRQTLDRTIERLELPAGFPVPGR